MNKEIIISIIIIVVIVSFDFALQKYTSDSIQKISEDISNLENDIKSQKLSNSQIEEEADQVYENWLKYNDKFVFYIEHNELEKVDTNFIAGKSFIKSEEYHNALAELDKTNYILKHIKDKYAFNLENIF